MEGNNHQKAELYKVQSFMKGIKINVKKVINTMMERD